MRPEQTTPETTEQTNIIGIDKFVNELNIETVQSLNDLELYYNELPNFNSNDLNIDYNELIRDLENITKDILTNGITIDLNNVTI